MILFNLCRVFVDILQADSLIFYQSENFVIIL